MNDDSFSPFIIEGGWGAVKVKKRERLFCRCCLILHCFWQGLVAAGRHVKAGDFLDKQDVLRVVCSSFAGRILLAEK